MPFNGSGGFARVMDWTNDRDAAIKIKADRHDQNDDDIANGLSNTICRDGQSQITANIPFNGKRITGLANPVDPQDGATKKYADDLRNFATPIVITGADANGRLRFTGNITAGAAGRPVGIEFAYPDLFFGVLSSLTPAGGKPNRWIWNDKADGTGTTVMELYETGILNFTASLVQLKLNDKDALRIFPPAGSSGGGLHIYGNNLTLVPYGPPDSTQNYNQFNMYDGSGVLRSYIRTDFVAEVAYWAAHNAANVEVSRLTIGPGGAGLRAANPQFSVDKTASGQNATFTGRTNLLNRWGLILGGTTAEAGSNTGSNFHMLRYNDAGVSIAEVFNVNRATGLATWTSDIKVSNNFDTGTFSPSGASRGTSTVNGLTDSSANATSGLSHYRFYNPNGHVGAINTSGTTTSFATTSDENLKDIIGPYDPAAAIAIIRADPVRDFTWKADGSYAVGWGAQTSYAISQDLASPPPEPLPGETQAAPGEPGYIPWGVDQGKRTPYLWAAMSWALDQIDDLTARVAALEGTT